MIIKIGLSILFVLSLTTSYSQINQIIEIDEKHLGQEYRLTGYINTNDSGLIEFWAIQKDRKGSFIKDKSKRETLNVDGSWKKISLDGKLQKGTRTLTFGIWCTRTITKFYVDEIVIELNDNGTWKTLDITNADIEAPLDSVNNLSGWTLYPGYEVILTH